MLTVAYLFPPTACTPPMSLRCDISLVTTLCFFAMGPSQWGLWWKSFNFSTVEVRSNWMLPLSRVSGMVLLKWFVNRSPAWQTAAFGMTSSSDRLDSERLLFLLDVNFMIPCSSFREYSVLSWSDMIGGNVDSKSISPNVFLQLSPMSASDSSPLLLSHVLELLLGVASNALKPAIEVGEMVCTPLNVLLEYFASTGLKLFRHLSMRVNESCQLYWWICWFNTSLHGTCRYRRDERHDGI